MEPVHSAALLLVGCWLLIYRATLRIPNFRPIGEVMTTVCCGLTLGLLAPLLPVGGFGIRAPLLAAVGVMLSLSHAMATALVVSLSLGAGVAGMIWQLGLCDATGGAPWLHPVLLIVTLLVFPVLFVCTPGVAGPFTMMIALLPALGSLLVVIGLSGLAGGLSPEGLMSEAPCAESGFFANGLGWPRTSLECLAAWLALAACGVALQLVLTLLAKNRVEEEMANGKDSLVASLLPEAQGREGPAANLPRPGGGNDRYTLITKAIFADEGADLSHLSEMERKIVEVCRKDEFERDRILWGGGLI